MCGLLFKIKRSIRTARALTRDALHSSFCPVFRVQKKNSSFLPVNIFACSHGGGRKLLIALTGRIFIFIFNRWYYRQDIRGKMCQRRIKETKQITKQNWKRGSRSGSRYNLMRLLIRWRWWMVEFIRHLSFSLSMNWLLPNNKLQQNICNWSEFCRITIVRTPFGFSEFN